MIRALTPLLRARDLSSSCQWKKLKNSKTYRLQNTRLVCAPHPHTRTHHTLSNPKSHTTTTHTTHPSPESVTHHHPPSPPSLLSKPSPIVFRFSYTGTLGGLCRGRNGNVYLSSRRGRRALVLPPFAYDYYAANLSRVRFNHELDRKKCNEHNFKTIN